MTKKKLFEALAKQHLRIETLRDRNSDSLDFHDVGVASLRDFAEACFQAGKDSLKGTPINPPPAKRCGGGGNCGNNHQCGCAGCR